MWNKVASLILRNRTGILTGLFVTMLVLIAIIYTKGLTFTTTNAQLLPSSDPVMVNFNEFLNTFGQEDNVIVIGYKDPKMEEDDNFLAWKKLSSDIQKMDGIDGLFSLSQAQKLVLDTATKGFLTEKIVPKVETSQDWKNLLTQIKNYPFYNSLLYQPKTGAMQTIVYLKPEIVNSKKREQIVFSIDDKVKEFEKQTGIELYLSGMPVIRTMNAKEVKSETFMFILGALFVTSFIFYLFYRSFRATAVSILVVVCAVILCFAMISLFGYEITLLTALVPPLLIVIGIPNCIFLINSYQSEYKKHKNKIKALQRTIVHIGNAALLTNFTTAFGFFTFVFTESSTLREFGIIASLSIVGIFILSFLIIPTAYSYFPAPKPRHLKHLQQNWTNRFLQAIENLVMNHRKMVYLSTIIILIISLVGISLMRRSGNMLDDMSKNAQFYKDISFFDNEFGGVLPLEIMVDTKRANGVSSLTTLRKIDQLDHHIDSLGKSSKTLSVVQLVKLAKQGYFGNNPKFYSLPTNQERAFILNAIRNSKGDANLLSSYIDSTNSKARITTLIQNMESSEMEKLILNIQNSLDETFPKEQFNTYVTGMAYVFMKGTRYLTQNLLISLSLAIFMIAIFMAFMFRSPQMIFIALIPNFLPLLMTAGLMGYLNIPIKPSTILVFSIAFGIAVDDTIHFLAKYRQELHHFNGNISRSVKTSLEEVGQSMFYTSVILFAGFSVFMFSGFKGIVALGGLVSFTLLCAMFTNLILLPSLLISYEQFTTKDFSDPDVDYFKEEEE